MADTLFTIPSSVRATLWSYDIEKIQKEAHKKIIICQVLNYGTKEAVDWLFATYTKEEITFIAQTIPSGQWNKKSLSFWKFYLGINPQDKLSMVLHG